jgi:hypothetical protein
MKVVGPCVTADIPDASRFSGRVVKFRNMLAHGESNPPDAVEVFKLNEQLRILIEACLLREIGFSAEIILGLVVTWKQFNPSWTFPSAAET